MSSLFLRDTLQLSKFHKITSNFVCKPIGLHKGPVSLPTRDLHPRGVTQSQSRASCKSKLQRNVKVSAAPESLHSTLMVKDVVEVPKPRNGPISGAEKAELAKRFIKLQNGSDVRGIAMAGVPSEPVTLTAGAAFFIGYALARSMMEKVKGPARFAIGRDCRMSGRMLESCLQAGLIAGGASKADAFGLCTTPAMFYATLDAGYHGAIMVTASHMPWNANGFKFFTAAGGFEKSDVAALLSAAAEAAAEEQVMLGDSIAETGHIVSKAMSQDSSSIAEVEYLPRYAEMLRGLIIEGVGAKEQRQQPLRGLKIVVDAGNGAGGFFATQVLAPLGADITGSQFLEPDGSFPNHIPNPENPRAMAAGAKATVSAGADMGIVFDTDVDRSAIVDRNGKEINSNRFIALMSAVVLREQPGSTIVTDSVTSNGLADFIKGLGGQHFRYKRGYKNVIGKGVELNKQGVKTPLMMETSGHGALSENHYLDDGAYLAVKVIIELVRRRLSGEGDIGLLLDQLKEPVESREFRLRIVPNAAYPEFKDVGEKVLDRFQQWVRAEPQGPTGQWTLDAVNHEGWRINVEESEGKTGWLLLRQSLHDPLLVLNIESEVAGGVQQHRQRVLEFVLKTCQGLPIDVTPLQK